MQTQTTNENHIDFPTPYLCLRARLFQCFINKATLCLLIPMISLLIATRLIISVEFQQKSTQSARIEQTVSLNRLYKKLDTITAREQFTLYKSILEAQSKISINVVNNSVQNALKYCPESWPDFTYNFTVWDNETSNLLQNAETETVTSLDKENESLSRAKDIIKSQALSVAQIDYSDLTLNYSWANSLYENLNTTLLQSSQTLSQYINETLQIQRKCNATMLQNLLQAFSQNLSDALNTQVGTLNQSLHTILEQLPEFELPGNKNSDWNHRCESIRSVQRKWTCIIGSLALMISAFNIVFIWFKFHCEQHASKYMERNIALTKNHLAIAHDAVHSGRSSVVAILCQILMKLQNSRGKYLSKQQEIHVSWIVSWSVKYADLLMVVWAMAIAYFAVEELESSMLPASTAVYAVPAPLYISPVNGLTNYTNFLQKSGSEFSAVAQSLCDTILGHQLEVELPILAGTVVVPKFPELAAQHKKEALPTLQSALLELFSNSTNNFSTKEPTGLSSGVLIAALVVAAASTAGWAAGMVVYGCRRITKF